MTSQHLQSTVEERINDKILGAPVLGRGGTQPCKIYLSSDRLVSGKKPPKMFSLGSVSPVEGSGETLSTSHKRVSEPVPSLLSPEPQLEYTARLDFLWRVQAKEEINEMKELREHNENMLRNILPSHVARHFLEKDRDNEVSPGLSGPRGRAAVGGLR